MPPKPRIPPQAFRRPSSFPRPGKSSQPSPAPRPSFQQPVKPPPQARKPEANASPNPNHKSYRNPTYDPNNPHTHYEKPRAPETMLAMFIMYGPRGAWYSFLATCAITLYADHIMSIDHVNGDSMAPSINPHFHETGQRDWLAIRRGHIPADKIRRGDVITMWKPHKPGEVSIKRVIGLPGDVVFPTRGEYGRRVKERREKKETGEELGGWYDGLEERSDGGITVPWNHMWVEGDNWRKTLDSCDLGPVSMALVDGKATKVWRSGFWRDIPDKREKKGKTKVIQGTKPETPLEAM